MFISTLTENQIVAAILTFGVVLVLWLIDAFARNAGSGSLLSRLSILQPLQRLRIGGHQHGAHRLLSVTHAGRVVSDLQIARLAAVEGLAMKEQLKKADVFGLVLIASAMISYLIRKNWTNYQWIVLIAGAVSHRDRPGPEVERDPCRHGTAFHEVRNQFRSFDPLS